MNYKLSVIIPIYNVEKYIERCLHSLFNQTLNDIEYIFVDDASTDNSIKLVEQILNNYPERKEKVKFIKFNEHKGIAEARKMGILNSAGEYIIHCDPDDYIELDMYKVMYMEAINKNVDIVSCNYWIENNEGCRIVKKIYSKNPQICLKKFYKKNRDVYSLWDKLVLRKLVIENNIVPFESCNYGEDLGCIIRILYYAKSISHINKPLYHYCYRKNSLTQIAKNINFFYEYDKLLKNIEKFAIEHDIKIKRTIGFLKFYKKIQFRYYFDNLKDWFYLYYDSHKYILSYSVINYKTRLFFFFLLKNLNIYIYFQNILKI